MAREMLLAGVDPEELKPAPKIPPPTTPKGKWENFWYHYKWAFIGTVVGVIVFTVLMVQTLSRDPADYHVVLVTQHALMDNQIEAMERAMEAYGSDIDGDGKVEVFVQNCYMGKSGSQEFLANSMTFQSHIAAGDVALFVWEPKYYEDFYKSVASSAEDGFQFLATLPFKDNGVSEDGVLWDWKEHPCRKDVNLQLLPEDLYFGVRTPIGTAEKSEKMQKQCMELLKNFATQTKPADQPVKK